MTRPTVGVVAYRLRPGRVSGWPMGGFGVPENYIEAIWRAGGAPTLLLPGDDTPAADLLAPLRALVLVGGGDIDPSRYGQEPNANNYGADPIRDAFEIDLLVEADRRGTPTLAVCRGMQVMNVAFGGSLFQHLPDEGRFGEHGRPTSGEPSVHDVTLVAGTRVATAAGAPTLRSSCHHHQGVDRVGDGLTVAARAADGLVEAIEREGDGWMVGVEWHPEDTANADPAQQRIFDALVERARG